MNEIEISLKDLWSLFLRRLKWIILIAVIAALAAAVYTYFYVTPMYTSSVTMLASSYGDRTNASVTYAELTASQGLIKSYTTLIKSNRVLSKVAERLEGEFSVGQLRGMVVANGIEETQIITISIETDDPQKSARVGNAVADILPAEVASWEMGGKIEVIDRAVVPSGQSSPNMVTNVIIAMIVAIVLGYGIFFVFERMDTVLHDEDQLKRTFDVPILGTIPPLDERVLGYGEYGGKKGGADK